MPIVHVTEFDSKAAHQIRLFIVDSHKIAVSCACRRLFGINGHNHVIFGHASTSDIAFTLYDNPKYHRLHRGIEFVPGMRTPKLKYYLN